MDKDLFVVDRVHNDFVDLVALNFLVLDHLKGCQLHFVLVANEGVPDVDLPLTVTDEHSVIVVKANSVGVTLLHDVLVATVNLLLTMGVHFVLSSELASQCVFQVVWGVLRIHDELQGLVLKDLVTFVVGMLGLSLEAALVSV